MDCDDGVAVPHGKGCAGRRELLLVLEGELYLVPFPVLKPGGNADTSEYLCERFSLLVVPSLTSLRCARSATAGAGKANGGPGDTPNGMPALVVGNPLLPNSVTEQWGWGDIPHAEQEAVMVADMLQAQGLVQAQASKEAVLRQIGEAECVHLATHMSWKLSAIVLSPGGDMVDSQQPKRYLSGGGEQTHEQGDEEGSEVNMILYS